MGTPEGRLKGRVVLKGSVGRAVGNPVGRVMLNGRVGRPVGRAVGKLAGFPKGCVRVHMCVCVRMYDIYKNKLTCIVTLKHGCTYMYILLVATKQQSV